MATTPTVEAILHFNPVTLRLIKTRLAFRVAGVGGDPVVAWHLGCCDVARRKARGMENLSPCISWTFSGAVARVEADPVP